MTPEPMPTDLTMVSAELYASGALVKFYPSGYQCGYDEYQKAYGAVAQWNPLEVGGSKIAGLIERYLRTGDPHEAPEDPFGEGGFIDEW